MNEDYILCENVGCTNKAVWIYMPSPSFFVCDDCVRRGCTCNEELPEGAEWLTEEEILSLFPAMNVDKMESFVRMTNGTVLHHSEVAMEEPLDEKGRKYPCCEYFYEEEGFLVSEYDRDNEEDDEDEL